MPIRRAKEFIMGLQSGRNWLPKLQCLSRPRARLAKRGVDHQERSVTNSSGISFRRFARSIDAPKGNLLCILRL